MINSLLSRQARRALLGLFLTGALGAGFSSNVRAAAGDLFVSDTATNSIIVYHPDGTKFTFATGLNEPFGIGFDIFGNLYEADLGSGRIFKFLADGSRSVYASGLARPAGLVFQENRNQFYVAENGADRVTNFNIRDGSNRLYASIPNPIGVGYDNPFLFVTNNSSEYSVMSSGDTPTIFSTGDASRGVVVDNRDKVFVSTDTGTILEIDGAAGTKTIFASGLAGPKGLALDGDPDHGNLFVAEQAGGRITQFSRNGTRTTFATGGTPNQLAFQPALSGKLANISTRGHVLTGENVLIGGFIIPGSASKTVLIRGIGPSLAGANPPVPGSLADPVLELHKPDGSVVINDNWKSSQKAKILATGLAPTNDLEAAIKITLPPGQYTTIERGKNGSVGVALVEIYDLDVITADSELANLSTRAFADTGDNVMIGGFIIRSSDAGGSRVLVRALGPSLARAVPPVTGALANPTLELLDSNGTSIFNDNWKDEHPAAIQATGLAPTDDRESAILLNLVPGPYTAIVRGRNDTTGVALVEVYRVR